ncbi:MAG TPA: M48 family metallopeptidase [bacterium]|nr:M48 family metallopeptidase [bacterium]
MKISENRDSVFRRFDWGGLCGAKFAAILVIVLAGCATGGLTRLAGDLFVPPEQEIKLGQQFAAEIPKEYKICTDEVIQAYVRDVGTQIATAASKDRSDVTYTFTVIDDPEQVNAFAVPGGYIYVFTGLMLFAENEAELASVLGHEAGHIVGRHSANQLGARIGLSLVSSVALGQNPTLLQQIVASMATTGSVLKFSRDDEREADSLGLKYTIQGGYDPNAMVSFMQRLHKKSGAGDSEVAAFLSTHPLTSERIGNLQVEMAKYGKTKGTLNEKAFKRIQEQIKALPKDGSATSTAK